MRDSGSRRIRTADIMMLIAASAAGFGLVRFMYHDHYLGNYLITLNENQMPGKLVLILQDLVQVGSPIVLVLTIATLGLVLATALVSGS